LRVIRSARPGDRRERGAAESRPGARQRALGPYGTRLVVTYAGLIALTVIGVVVTESSSAGAVGRYGPNLVAELIGILVTVVVVERLFAWQRRRAAAPVQVVALRRFWYQLNRLIHMIVFSYKAAAPAGSPRPTSVDELLDRWCEHAPLLDFRRDYGPDLPRRTWLEYAADVTHDFEAGIRDIFDRYLDVLGAELPAAAEDLIDHPIFGILKHGRAIQEMDRQHQLDLPRLCFVVLSVEDPSANTTHEFAEALRQLYRAYDRLGGRPVTLDERLYEDDLSPPWASARWEPPTTGTPPAGQAP
jgi:hypothetical protein